MTRTLVAMSGGVDSSVAAALLVEAGHEVVGVTMKTFCYSGPTHARSCCGLDGIADARRVADRLGIPHYVFDVEEAFTRDVIDDFVDEYAQGRTPNPCVQCNSNTKFLDLLERGRALGCAAIASGHYVRVRHAPEDGLEGTTLLRGSDPDKDQAYFLWGLPRSILPLLRFPLGGMTKGEVRERARALGLATADKPESQEICFVPTGNYRDLLEKRLPPTHHALSEGPIVDEQGRVLGRHRGFASFTVGQRRGLGGGFPDPMYVLEIRPSTREVVVGPRHRLSVDGLLTSDLNWVADPPELGSRLQVQYRHRAEAVDCTLIRGSNGSLEVRFPVPQSAVTPGQSAVFFDGDRLLGGGRILRAVRAEEAERTVIA